MKWWYVCIFLIVLTSVSANQSIDSRIPAEKIDALSSLPFAQEIAELAPRHAQFRIASSQPKQTVIVQMAKPQDINQYVRTSAVSNPEVQQTINAYAKQGIRTHHEYKTFPGFSAQLTQAEIDALRESPLIRSIEPDITMHAMLSSSKGVINVTDVLNMSIQGQKITGKGTSVCVIDTGIDYGHVDFGSCSQAEFLAGTCEKVPAGFDFHNNDSDPMDDGGHGTHVAGTIAANGSNVGVAPGAKIIAVKSLGTSTGNTSDIIAGIDYCVDNAETYNITAISMSLGVRCDLYPQFCYSSVCDSSHSNWATVVNAAIAKNITVVGASGNDDNYTHINLPSCLSNVTAVTASNDADSMASFANRNSLVEITAPGVSITATNLGGGSDTLQGTSMATPHVSALITLLSQALTITENPKTPSELVSILVSTGDGIFDSETSETFARINAGNAFASLNLSTPTTNASYPVGWQSEPFNVTLNASGDNAINYTTYRIDEGAWVNGTVIEINTTGEFDIEFYSVDVNNNQEASNNITVQLDLVSPTTTATFDRWYMSSLLITLSALDNHSGINYTTYSYNNLSINSSTINIIQEGDYVIEYFSVDNVNNTEATKNLTAGLDLTNPLLNISSPTSWQNNSFTITWNASDALSGLNQTQYQIDNGSWINASNVSIETQGNFTVSIRALDIAGNQNQSSVQVLLDTSAPNTTDNSPVSWQNSSFVVTLSAIDNLSGVNYTTYRLANNSLVNGTQISISQEGNHTITYFSVDNVQNIEGNQTAYAALDTTAANLTVNTTPNWLSADNFTLTINASDALSGVQQTTINNTITSSLLILQQANTTVTVTVTDNAGNTNSQLVSVLLDALAPNTTINASSDWYTQSTLFYLNATDTLSGVNYTTYYLENGTTLNSSNLTLSGEQNTTITYYSVDVAGNQEDNNTQTILIDTLAPRISTITLNESAPVRNETINISATLNETFLANATITINGSTSNFSNYSTYSSQTLGTQTITITAYDLAGNSAQQTKQFTVYQRERQQDITVNDTQINASNTTKTRLRIKTNSSVVGNITILASKQKPITINRSLPRAIKHTTIQLSQNIRDTLEWANLTMEYEDADVDSLNESSLFMAYYNESADEWVNLTPDLNFVSSVGINTQTNEVWANVSQFSTYALTGNEPQEAEEDTSSDTGSSSGGSSGGGGGGGSSLTTTSQQTNTIERSLRLLRAQEPVQVQIQDNRTDIHQVEIVPESDAFLATLQIEIQNISSDAPSQAYQQVNMSVSGVSVQEATIQVNASDVEVYIKQGSWQQLSGQQQESIYEFNTENLGVFVFVKSTDQTQVVQQDTSPEISEVEEQPTTAVLEGRNQSNTTQNNVSSANNLLSTGSSKYVFMWLAALAIIAIGIALIETLREKD